MAIRPETKTSLDRARYRILEILHRSPFLKFLIVGVLSFGLDFGILVGLHEGLNVDLVIATPVAFLTSLVFNFILQRTFTFRAANSRALSAAKYIALVVVNVVVTDFIVTGFDRLEWAYGIGKVVATVLTTTWNFLLYRNWIFRHDTKTDAEQAPALD
jgi:putative flippase GtrA